MVLGPEVRGMVWWPEVRGMVWWPEVRGMVWWPEVRGMGVVARGGGEIQGGCMVQLYTLSATRGHISELVISSTVRKGIQE